MKQYLKTLILVTSTAALTFSATSLLFSVKDKNVGANNGETQNLERKIETINTYIDKNYLYDDVDYKKASDAALKAYVESLEEPYTHYYSKEEFEQYINRVEESYTGIGVVISVDTEADKIAVVAPFADSPAYKADIKPGDYIISVDGKTFNSSQSDECVDAIKGGKEGTTVKLVIERDGKQIEKTVTRSVIYDTSVDHEMLDDDIGYVAITAFNMNGTDSERNTFTEFKDAIESLENDGMKKLIIDLRDNPGGVVDVVCDIADYILPEGVITYTETRLGKKHEYKSDENKLDIPIVVLINENSASASEILTGALKDYDYAKIVGKKSFGKGIVQEIFPFTDGSGMSMTVSKYFTPNGTSIHGVGVEPDYDVSLPEKYDGYYTMAVPREDDTQLQKALEILK